MATSFRQTTPDDVVGKVLRRAEVAKMARKLQDRLALANYKAQNGQERLSFKDVEARLDSTIKRKRPSSSMETSSTSSSSSSDRHMFSNGVASSPLTDPIMFSDAVRSSNHIKTSRRIETFPAVLEDTLEPSKRMRSHSMAPPLSEASRTSWKSNYNLAQSSPVYRHHESHFPSSNPLNQSFASEMSTIPDSPPFGHISEDGNDRPANSFSRMDSSNFNSSPPRTPPPTRHRNRKSGGGEEGADLLLYLATSPSPANPGHPSRIFAPSTPPFNNQGLPSAMLNTPGGLGGFGTPGQQFNFADFVNITPSPAQGAFGNRTPGPAKTPLAAKEARRRLTFDTLAPPSPNTSNVGRGAMGKESGLGMELGGELVSSQ